MTLSGRSAVKALILLALAIFLYTRIASGTLNFYISQRFAPFTFMATLALPGPNVGGYENISLAVVGTSG